MHNLGTVIAFEFVRTIKKKSFWLGTLAFPVMMAAIVAISYFSGQTASQAEEDEVNERFSMVVLDTSGLILPDALASLEAGTIEDKAAGVQKVREGSVDAFVYYPEDPSTEKIEVYAKDVGLSKNSKYTTIAEELLKGSVAQSIDSSERVAIIRGQMETDLTTYVDGEQSPGFERALAPGFFLLIFYLVIVLLGSQMLTSTTEEKENRVIEMILTSVKAKTLIVGKIVSLLMLGILQIAVTLLPAVIALVFFGEQLALPSLSLADLPLDPMRITIAVAIFFSAFLLFTGLLVAIGASVPTAKEASSFFGVAIGGMFVPLYALMAILTSPDQLMVKIFTYFPLTAPVTLLLRNAAGNLSLLEAVIGIFILVVCSVFTLSVAIRAFRYGTLEYSRKLSIRELLGR